MAALAGVPGPTAAATPPDIDRDGLSNTFETGRSLTNPRLRDTDGDGTRDGVEDPDNDGLRTPPSRPQAPTRASPTRMATGSATRRIPTRPTCRPPSCRARRAARSSPLTNVWNTRIDTRPVRADSATLITSIGRTRTFHMDFGSYEGYGIPYQVVDSSTPRRAVTFDYDDESDPARTRSRTRPLIEGGSDGHLLMVDADACRLYELYAAHLSGGAWYAGSGAQWDLASNALRPAGWTSADAAGLPIVPGLVRYDEVHAGGSSTPSGSPPRRHAARTSIRPATGRSSSTSTSLPPMGLRVRLKKTANLTGLSDEARVIAVALQRYGMILADNGSPWYVSGMSDPRFDDDVLHELDRFTGADVEAVDTSGLVNGP